MKISAAFKTSEFPAHDLQFHLQSHSKSAENEVIDKSTIAELSMLDIDKMSCEELVQMIRTANLPLLRTPEFQRRLPLYDHNTLKRLAHLVRRTCQHQHSK